MAEKQTCNLRVTSPTLTITPPGHTKATKLTGMNCVPGKRYIKKYVAKYDWTKFKGFN